MLLRLHDRIKAPLLHFLLQLAFHQGSRRPILRGEGKRPDPVKRMGLQKFGQLPEFIFALAGEPKHHRCAQNKIIRSFANIIHHVFNMLPRTMAVHVLEQTWCNVLNRHIDILNDLIVGKHRIDQFFRYGIRISIKNADPLEPIDLAQCAKKFCKHWLSVKLCAVSGCILRDQRKFFHSIFCK